MSSGQMMLVIGAFMIFGIVRMNFQNTTLESETFMESNIYLQQSATIARALMDEIQQYPFDAAVGTKSIIYLSDLTACGPGNWETYPTWNDIDDFHGITFTSPPVGTTPSNTPPCLYGTEGYTVRVSVYYVNPNSPNTKSYTRTFAKRVDVQIANAFSDYVYNTSWVSCY